MIKKFAKSIREYKKPSILSPLCMIGEVITDVLIPYFMANLIDLGIEKANMAFVVRFGIMLLISALFSLLFGGLASMYAARASAGFGANLRKDMFYNIQSFSFLNIDKFSTSSLITRLTTDVSNVQNAYMMIIRTAIRAPFMLVFALIMAFNINKQAAIIYVAVMPFLGAALYIIIKKVHPTFKKVFKTYDKLNTSVQENVRGIRVVKAFVREEHEVDKFERQSGEIYNLFTKAEKILAVNMPLMQLAIYACMLFISWMAAKLIVGGTMTTGQLTSLMTYTMQILMNFMMLSMVFAMMIISRPSAERIIEVLDEETDLKDGEDPVYTLENGAIDFENVGFSYTGDPKQLALENINLHIASGQTIGVLGGTGSGKTSLVQLIPRLYDATLGTVKVAGIDVKKYHMDSLRDQVAMVLQKNVLFSGTIKDNLRWGKKDATDEEMIWASKIAQAHDFIEALPQGYDSYVEQGGTNFSGGQKQRLCIARALLKRPKIMILDDSTSAVDTKTDAVLRRSFNEELPQMTKIIIAQRVASVEEADQIVLMDNGGVQGVGTHEQLLKTNQVYQEIYHSQQKRGAEK